MLDRQNKSDHEGHKYSAHKTHTNHETLYIGSPILHTIHKASEIQHSQSTKDPILTKHNTHHYYNVHEALGKTLRVINNVHENLLNKTSHRSRN
jgi:hypothetical protein